MKIYYRKLFALLLFLIVNCTKSKNIEKKNLANKAPQRIISASLGSDEILWELLQNKKNRILALSILADHPSYSHIREQVTQLKARVDGNIESFLGLQPDLVILTSYNKPNLASQLNILGVKTKVLKNFTQIQDIKDHILQIGKLIAEEKPAKKLLLKFAEKIKNMHNCLLKCKKKFKIIALSSDRSLAGSFTLINDLIKTIGADNLIANSGINGWQNLPDELIFSLDPDWILSSKKGNSDQENYNFFEKSPVFSNMSATQKKKIIFIDEKDFSSVSHFFINAISKVAKTILADKSCHQPKKNT